MTSIDRPVIAQDPSLFELTVRGRSWDWLLELRRWLKIDLLLVDDRLSILLPAQPSDQPGLSSLLDGDATVRDAIEAALKSRRAQSRERGGFQIVCTPIFLERGSPGALLVGRSLPPRQDATPARAQLEMVGSWLSTAVDAHLQSPPTFAASGLDRVAPLAQVLGQAADCESDRELIRLFGEAIAVWHDIDVCAYVETSNGTFMRDIGLPGAKQDEGPASIASAGLPESTELTQLPQGHLDRFGLPVQSDVYVRRFRRDGGRAWLLMFTGAIDGYDLQRLSAYAGLLELALAVAMGAITNRVVSTVSRLLADEVSPETRAGRALEALRTTVGAASASLTIESGEGIPLLRVNRPDSRVETRAEPGAVQLVLVKRSERHYTTTISMARHESLPFTPCDHEAASAAAATFAVSAPVLLRTGDGRRERRAASRGFQEVLERSAREALEQGLPVAMVVMMTREATSPGSTQRWVAAIRAQTRASDVAGMLTEGEIGLLMQDAHERQARRIAERLSTAAGRAAGQELTLIGVASRGPGEGAAAGLLREARADAIAAGRRSRPSDSSREVNG